MATTNGLSFSFSGNGWGSGITESITVKNDSGAAITEWELVFESEVAITSIWGAVLVSSEKLSTGKYQYTIKNESWNGNIANGSSLNFGFSATCSSSNQINGNIPSSTFSVISTTTTNTTTSTTTATTTGTTTTTATATVVNDDDSLFSPYVDMTLWPTANLIINAWNQGVTDVTCAFLTADSSGNICWGGYSTLQIGSSDSQEQAIESTIAAFQVEGGTVTVSFGGASGVSPAARYSSLGKTAAELAVAYQTVISGLNVTRLDFDIEGSEVCNSSANNLNAQALELLQDSNSNIEIWLTLPVLPSGLTSDGLAVVEKYLAAGVNISGINIMAMDYGDSSAPLTSEKTMGYYAILSAKSTYSQLSTLFAKYGYAFSYSNLGVTPMIGQNDTSSEVFTLTDAKTLETWAEEVGLGELSMWELGRDYRQGSALYNSTEISTGQYAFTDIFSDYDDSSTATSIAPATTTADTTATSTATATATTTTGTTATTTATITTTDNGTMAYVFGGSGWGSGYTGSCVVSNSGTSAVESWSVTFTTDAKITSVWSAVLSSSTQLSNGMYEYTVTGESWTSEVTAGGSVTWGFSATCATSNQISGTVSSSNFTIISATDYYAATTGTTTSTATATSTTTATTNAPVTATSTATAASTGTTATSTTTATTTDTTVTSTATSVDTSSLYNVEIGDTLTSEQLAVLDAMDFGGSAGSPDTTKIVATYYGDWFTYGRDFQISDIPAADYNRIYFAFCKLDTSGNVSFADNYADLEKTYSTDSWESPIAGEVKQLWLLKQRFSGLETYMSIGGWTYSGSWATMASTAEGRETFAKNAVAMAKEYGFDGIDIDWEYPGVDTEYNSSASAADKNNFTLLCEALKTELDNAGLSLSGKKMGLSICVGISEDAMTNIDYASVKQYVNQINVMAYDCHGAWDNDVGSLAPLYSDESGSSSEWDVNDAIINILAAMEGTTALEKDGTAATIAARDAIVTNASAADKNLLNVGVSYAARGWKLSTEGTQVTVDNFTSITGNGAAAGSWENGVADYKDIVLAKSGEGKLASTLSSNYTLLWDEYSGEAIIYDNDEVYTVDTQQSIALKAKYVSDMGLGGIFSWDCSADYQGELAQAALNGLNGNTMGGTVVKDGIDSILK